MGHALRKNYVFLVLIFSVLVIPFPEIVQAKKAYVYSLSITHDELGYSKEILIATYIHKVFERAGFELTSEEGKPSDLELEIEVHARPLAAQYSYFRFGPGTTNYTGAEVEGKIYAVSSESQIIEKSFTGELPPPSRIKSSNTDKSKAPFFKAWRTSNFFQLLGEIIDTFLGTEAATSYWIGVMQTRDLKRGPQATYALTEIGPTAVPRLIFLFNSAFRERALKTLHQIGDPAVPYLLSALENDHPYIQTGAIDALGRIKSPEGIQPIAKLLTNADLTVRKQAVMALTKFGLPAKDSLIQAFQSEDADVRTIAIEGLGTMQAPDVMVVLMKGFHDPDPDVHNKAVAGLKNHGEEAVEILIQELHTENYDHLFLVVNVLGDLGQKKAIVPLISTLNTLNANKFSFRTRVAIGNALKKLTDQDHGLDDEAWLKWWEAEEQFQ